MLGAYLVSTSIMNSSQLRETLVDASMTHTKQPPTRLSLAWLLAAEDLQFGFIAPYAFVDGDGHSHSCSGLVVHFGSPQGTLIEKNEFV